MNTRTETEFLERYQKLNEAQRKAVDTIEGPVMVIAGPGTGKTELLSVRTLQILRSADVLPHNILLLTFTENGASNMRDRIAGLIGADAYRISIFTFHAFCNHIISRYPEHFFKAASFEQVSDIAKAEILEGLFKDLPHNHPLGSYHPSKGYVYLRDVKDRIKHIKSYGLTAEEYLNTVKSFETEYAEINSILGGWPEGRLSIKNISIFDGILGSIAEIDENTNAHFLLFAFGKAIEDARKLGKTAPLSDFKKKYLDSKDGKVVYRDSVRFEKLIAVAEMYKAYSDKMYELGYYDYDDMIVDVVHVLRTNESVRASVQEQYLYTMVDEFQDTNEAQMTLVELVCNNPVYENKPNICVVGDDDQAVYKFQGAEVSHMMRFRSSLFSGVQTIVLDKNYRSTQSVLDTARKLIVKGESRLENKFEDITKVLTSMNSKLAPGEVSSKVYASDVEEYSVVASKIHEAIQKGTAPEEIAVIARGHKELKAFLPYLDRKQIPYEYIKKSNVFDEKHIQEMMYICEYASSFVTEGNRKDYLLPKILSFPFFQIDRTVLFDIAVESKEKHLSWIGAIREHSDRSVQKIYRLLVKLVGEAENLPLERFIEMFMEESGFKDYYFGPDVLRTEPTRYISFLASLKTFIEAMREYKDGSDIFVADVGPFVQVHKDGDIPLVSESPFMRTENSIQLLTAHASKGLEFEMVFLISVHHKLWAKTPRTNIAPLPSPLISLMQPAGDTEDDFIRLLYVALTRAKHTLSVTAHDKIVSFLLEAGDESEEGVYSGDENQDVPIEAHEDALALVSAPYKEDEWALLGRLVRKYQMPITHLSNFTDLTSGGPLYFVEQNLLRFPQPINPAGAFGSAVHKAIEKMVTYPKYSAGDPAELPHIIAIFRQEILKSRLDSKEFVRQVERGTKILTDYYHNYAKSFSGEDLVEVNMKDEGVFVGEAHLTGKIDFLRVENGKYSIVDWKTGKSFDSWDAKGLDDYEKIKLHKYRQQLIVYKILLESSINYKKLPVGTLALEFVEENPVVRLVADITDEEEADMKVLLEAVYKKIVKLDFPNFSAYKPDYKGILAFEKDLREGLI